MDWSSSNQDIFIVGLSCNSYVKRSDLVKMTESKTFLARNLYRGKCDNYFFLVTFRSQLTLEIIYREIIRKQSCI